MVVSLIHIQYLCTVRRAQLYPQDVVERKLGQNVVRCRQHTKVRWSFKWDCAYDIPLLESLRQVVNNESILNEVIVILMLPTF